MQVSPKLMAGLCLLFLTGCGGNGTTLPTGSAQNGSKSNSSGSNNPFSNSSASNGSVSSSSAQNVPVVSSPRQFGNLQFTEAADKSVYAPGEPVQLTFTYQNVGTQSMTFATHCKPLDYKVFQGGTLVYHWNGGASGCGGTTPVTLAPGESATLQATWSQISDTGTQVPSSQYTIKMWLSTSSSPNNGGIPDIAQGNPETNTAADPIQITIQ
jgi:hypothetical protein